jgi:phosphoribosylaminoimidazole-succinocarboxamide synthase
MLSSKTIRKVLPFTFKTIDISSHGRKYQGKVRDYYKFNGNRILVTTDRISAFDRVLGYIPFKGQVLNQLSAFWFEKTGDIIENHLIALPHPNIAIAKEAVPYPVEMVIRGYITGVTSTSIWHSYKNGERIIYGIKFPEGLRKNQKLSSPVLTPTTKAEHGAHDERLTREDIIRRKIIPLKILKQMESASLNLYERGNSICRKKGLILVDTKYEFADYRGKMILIDEIHTPDSSRFWKASNYTVRFGKGLEPENFDKEFFRKWYVERKYRGDGDPPIMSSILQIKTAIRYIKIYEMITGRKFNPIEYPVEKQLIHDLSEYMERKEKK